MRYEIIIQRTQPPCGGKSPKVVDFRNADVDDPLSYVIMNEPNLLANVDIDIDESKEGIVVISFTSLTAEASLEFFYRMLRLPVAASISGSHSSMTVGGVTDVKTINST